MYGWSFSIAATIDSRSLTANRLAHVTVCRRWRAPSSAGRRGRVRPRRSRSSPHRAGRDGEGRPRPRRVAHERAGNRRQAGHLGQLVRRQRPRVDGSPRWRSSVPYMTDEEDGGRDPQQPCRPGATCDLVRRRRRLRPVVRSVGDVRCLRRARHRPAEEPTAIRGEHILTWATSTTRPRTRSSSRMIVDQPTAHVLVVGFVNIHTHQAEEMLEYFEHEAQAVGCGRCRRRRRRRRPRRRVEATRRRLPSDADRAASTLDQAHLDLGHSGRAGHARLLVHHRGRALRVHVGVAVSMLLYERRHLTTGSIVVPGYIATFIADARHDLWPPSSTPSSRTWLINKVLRKWFLLYGRTKFTVLALDVDPDPER